MKSPEKILIRFIRFGLIFFPVLYAGLFFFFNAAWRTCYSKKQVESAVHRIQNTHPLPDSFYIIYDMLFQDSYYKDRHETINKWYLKRFWREDLTFKTNNWQFQVARTVKGRNFGHLFANVAALSLAFKLNRSVTPERCFDYWMANLYNYYHQQPFFRSRYTMDNISGLKTTDHILRFLIAGHRNTSYLLNQAKLNGAVDSLKSLLFLKASKTNNR